ncbi:hypothetical protein [Thalassotalea profundi]|uniref:Outer membrane protein beta-barrel domain-containing protein n=1 Tax=Thalassotalea profundi TaxID=2036687 RepID=A0ABQ3IR80_9GAMM|nr:hypothetical protein [Thalassotalea profundi]GHE91049.1 hypothetical protein GCM10011501_20610 [Thalassotalea profundi]
MNTSSSKHFTTGKTCTMWQKFAAISLFLIANLTTVFTANATDFSFNLHQGDQSEIKGFSFYVADNFTRKSNFYWQLGYSSYKDLSVAWNNDELFFDINNVEGIVSYRHKIKSYNKFINSLTVEYQVGAAVVMTENKFTWPELQEAKFFSEKGDVNPLIGMALHYSFSRNTSLVFGVRYQPEVSEFGDMSSIYIGVDHKFNQVGY